MIGGQHVLQWSKRGDPAVGQCCDAVADGGERVEIVRDHEDGEAKRPLQRSDQRVEFAGRDRIEARGGLVQEQQRGIERERAGQRYALGHAAGQFGGELVAVVRGQPDHFELGVGDLVQQRGERCAASRSGNWMFCRALSAENSAPC